MTNGNGLAGTEMPMLLVLRNRHAMLREGEAASDRAAHALSVARRDEIELPPGPHTLQLVLGDADHLAFEPPLLSTVPITGHPVGRRVQRSVESTCAHNPFPQKYAGEGFEAQSLLSRPPSAISAPRSTTRPRRSATGI
jgi:uncharacterized protein DUF4399